MHNPSEIDQNQLLLVRFSTLGNDDIIIPGMANLSFNIKLGSINDKNRMSASNIGRAIIKKLVVKFEGYEISSRDDYDVLACYKDLRKTKSEKRNAVRQGIISNDGCTENCIRFRINAGNKASNDQDVTIANAYGDKFIIPIFLFGTRKLTVMKLDLTITTELLYHWEQSVIRVIRFQTYP